MQKITLHQTSLPGVSDSFPGISKDFFSCKTKLNWPTVVGEIYNELFPK